MRQTYLATAATAALALGAGAAAAQTTLTIESWRAEDQAIWDDVLLPAFEAEHPDIDVQFKPTAPTEYNAALNARLDGGTAGDLIVCRPFDGSLALFEKGQLADISDLEGLGNFPDLARAAWSTDDGSQTFCVPMASVIHGFIYNREAFEELGLEEPTTEEEFFAVLQAIEDDGTYIPLAMGTADLWEAATMGYTNIGPAYWKGEEGRQALIEGSAEFTDPEFVEPFEVLARWAPYMGRGFQAQGYTDSQNLFTLGRAAIYPAGSWEIGGFNDQAFFEMGAFPPPVSEDGTCYISDHTDIGIGMNAATENPEAARTFLEWVASPSSPRPTPTRCRASSRFRTQSSRSRTRWRRSSSPGARSARARSGWRTRSCRAASPTPGTTCGRRRPTTSTRRRPPRRRPRSSSRASRPGTSRSSSDTARGAPADGAPLAKQRDPGRRRDVSDTTTNAQDTARAANLTEAAEMAAPARTAPRRPRRRWHIAVFLAPAVLIYTVFSIYPLVESLRLSLYDGLPDGSAVWNGLGNYATLLFDPNWASQFWNALWNNLILFLIHMVVQNPIGLLLAALLSLAPRFGGRLPHADLRPHAAVGGHRRLHLGADPVADLGRRRDADGRGGGSPASTRLGSGSSPPRSSRSR